MRMRSDRIRGSVVSITFPHPPEDYKKKIKKNRYYLSYVECTRGSLSWVASGIVGFSRRKL